MTDRTVLITGATGFVGRPLVEAYAAAGWTVVGTCRTQPSDVQWIPRAARLVQLDLCDSQAVDRLVASTTPTIVCHLASQSSVSVSLRDPIGTLTNNITSQYNLLEAAAKHHPSARIVVVGSADEYGNVAPEDNPVKEEHPLEPANPYALSKVAQDLMAFQYVESRGLEVIRVRPFLQLGPRRSDQFVAGSFARQVAEIAAHIRPPIIEVGAIHLARDFTDVRDVAQALMLTADLGLPGSVYNIASGAAHTLREMLMAMLSHANIDAEIRVDPARIRPREMLTLIGDASRLVDHTGWRPCISFERSVQDTLDYWIERTRLVSA